MRILYYTILFSLYMLVSMVCNSQEKQNRQLNDSLKETVVTSSKVHRILQSGKEYVVDYTFLNDKVLVATYSGSNGKKAKLFLMSIHGDTLAKTSLPEEPLALYKSCVGRYYCICENEFYPIVIEGNSIELEKPRKLNLLWSIMPCQYAINDTFYYKYEDQQHFGVQYCWKTINDTVFHPIKSFYFENADRWNQIQITQIMALLESFNFREAARKDGIRHLMNGGTYAYIKVPLFRVNDTIIIFDLYKKNIDFFTLEGKQVKENKIKFDWKEIQYLQILQDDSTRRFYLHRRDDPVNPTIEELNIYTGEANTNKVAIHRSFPEDIKIHNGNIYFLWQDSHNAATRQLFMQLYP